MQCAMPSTRFILRTPDNNVYAPLKALAFPCYLRFMQRFATGLRSLTGNGALMRAIVDKGLPPGRHRKA